MALLSQIEAAARIKRAPTGTQAIDKEVPAPRVNDADRRNLAVGLCDVAIRHACNANEPEQGDPCTHRHHARDREEARDALILAGLAPDPNPTVARPPAGCATPIESRKARERRERDAAEAKLPRPDHGWRGAAACRFEDPALFFGQDGERLIERKSREREAKKVCAGCPVRVECLDGAIARNEQAGVWAALNPEQLAAERRRRARRSRAA